MHNRVDLKEC